jgi:signal recognition particle GTPase
MIEGGEGLGKTTRLAQFAQRHPDHTISVFIKAASRFGYDPATVRYDLVVSRYGRCVEMNCASQRNKV